MIWLYRTADPSYLQKLRDAGLSPKEIAEICGVSRFYVIKVTKSSPKPVKPILIKGESGIISISSTVLKKAGVDVSKELYGIWNVSDGVRLKILEYKTGKAYKLVRNRNTNARLIYLPKIVVRTIRDLYPHAEKFRWTVEGNKLLRLTGVDRVQVEKINIRELDQQLKVLVNVKSGKTHILFPPVIEGEFCAFGVDLDKKVLVIVPNTQRGLKLYRNGNWLAVRADKLRNFIKLECGEYIANLADVDGVKAIIIKFNY